MLLRCRTHGGDFILIWSTESVSSGIEMSLEDGVSSEANGAAYTFVGMNIVVMHVKSALGIEVSVARRAAE